MFLISFDSCNVDWLVKIACPVAESLSEDGSSDRRLFLRCALDVTPCAALVAAV